MPLKALVFDVDGTLADTERDGHRVAFNQAFAELGLPWHWDEALYGVLLRVAGGSERLRHYAHDHGGAARLPAGTDLDDLIPRIHRVKTRHYVQRVADGAVALRPGVARLIAEARGTGLRLAIATTTTHDNVIALLTATLGPEAPGWFEVMGTAREVAAKKPDPAVYRYALEQLGLGADEALAVEDSQQGLRAARAAGLRCLVTPTAYTASDDFTGALRVLSIDGGLDRHPDAQPARGVNLDDLLAWCDAPPPAPPGPAPTSPASMAPAPRRP